MVAPSSGKRRKTLRTAACVVILVVLDGEASARSWTGHQAHHNPGPPPLAHDGNRPSIRGEPGDNATSILGPSFSCGRIAFYKTTKTASSTAGGTLYRVGVMRGSRFHERTSHQHVFSREGLERSSQPADLTVNHLHISMKDALPHYRRVSGDPGLLTILRDPADRFVSEFYYSMGHRKTTVTQHGNVNRMAADICGAKTPDELKECLSSELFERTVFLLKERLNEGLAALHLHCGWPIKWLTSIGSNCASCGHTLRRFDCQLVPPPRPLDEAQKEELEQKHNLDRTLYEAALRKWEAIEERAGQHRLTGAAAEIRRQQGILSDYCHKLVDGASSPMVWAEHPGCLWLTLEDMEYESTVSSRGYVDMDAKITLMPNHSRGYGIHQPRAKPGEVDHWGPRCRFYTNVTVRDMVDDYGRMYDVLIGSSSSDYHQAETIEPN